LFVAQSGENRFALFGIALYFMEQHYATMRCSKAI